MKNHINSLGPSGRMSMQQNWRAMHSCKDGKRAPKNPSKKHSAMQNKVVFKISPNPNHSGIL